MLIARRAVGLREVFVDIESGAKEQVRRYQRPATAQRSLKALAMLRELGVALAVGFILFDPETYMPEILANLAFLKEAGLWDRDARMTKALRIQAGTPLVADYRSKELIVGPLDVDELLWPHRWVDPRVEAVHHAFRPWEAERMGEIYAIQAAARGEVPSEGARRERRRLFGLICVVEHEALEALARAADAGGDPTRMDLSRWSREREELNDQWGWRRAAWMRKLSRCTS